MIFEVAVLDVKAGEEADFDVAFEKARKIISTRGGYLSHQLQRCGENPSRYLLLVNGETLDDHTRGFREADEYQQWRALPHHFYDPFPSVEHYRKVFENSRPDQLNR